MSPGRGHTEGGSERPLGVLIVGPDDVLAGSLRQELSPGECDIVGVRPGSGFVHAARLRKPQIAVLDRVDRRREAAQTEIAVLRDARDDVRIIVVCEASSSEDARLVEEGIFYYLSPPSIGRLSEVIRAAAHSIRTRARPVRGGAGQAGREARDARAGDQARMTPGSEWRR